MERDRQSLKEQEYGLEEKIWHAGSTYQGGDPLESRGGVRLPRAEDNYSEDLVPDTSMEEAENVLGLVDSELTELIDDSFNEHCQPLPYRVQVTALITCRHSGRKTLEGTPFSNELADNDYDEDDEFDLYSLEDETDDDEIRADTIPRLKPLEDSQEDGSEAVDTDDEKDEEKSEALQVVEKVFDFIKNGTENDPRIQYQILEYSNEDSEVQWALEEDALDGTMLTPRLRTIRLRGGAKEMAMGYNTDTIDSEFSVVSWEGVLSRYYRRYISRCDHYVKGLGMPHSSSPGFGVHINFPGYMGTQMYMAPEVMAWRTIGGRPYGKAIDMWSFGVVVSFPADMWENVSEDAKNFIRACLSMNPQKRMTAKEGLTHHWFVAMTRLKKSLTNLRGMANTVLTLDDTITPDLTLDPFINPLSAAAKHSKQTVSNLFDSMTRTVRALSRAPDPEQDAEINRLKLGINAKNLNGEDEQSIMTLIELSGIAVNLKFTKTVTASQIVNAFLPSFAGIDAESLNNFNETLRGYFALNGQAFTGVVVGDTITFYFMNGGGVLVYVRDMLKGLYSCRLIEQRLLALYSDKKRCITSKLYDDIVKYLRESDSNFEAGVTAPSTTRIEEKSDADDLYDCKYTATHILGRSNKNGPNIQSPSSTPQGENGSTQNRTKSPPITADDVLMNLLNSSDGSSPPDTALHDSDCESNYNSANNSSFRNTVDLISGATGNSNENDSFKKLEMRQVYTGTDSSDYFFLFNPLSRDHPSQRMSSNLGLPERKITNKSSIDGRIADKKLQKSTSLEINSIELFVNKYTSPHRSTDHQMVKPRRVHNSPESVNKRASMRQSLMEAKVTEPAPKRGYLWKRGHFKFVRRYIVVELGVVRIFHSERSIYPLEMLKEVELFSKTIIPKLMHGPGQCDQLILMDCFSKSNYDIVLEFRPNEPAEDKFIFASSVVKPQPI
ncbi:unnamed protein product [Sphagnum balticum]